jgi:hypothetical protein
VTENLGAFLDDFGIVVTAGASTFKALFDIADDLVGGGVVISTDYVLTVRSTDIVGMVDGDTLSISSTNYEIRRILKIDDGALSRVVVSKV